MRPTVASGYLVEKKINGGNPAVPGNDEISPGVSWRLTRAARYPLDPPAIAHFLGPGNWLISKVRGSSPDRARDAIDLVAPTVDALAGIVEHAILGEDLVDGRAPTRGIIFTEDVLKIAGQQRRYAVGHSLSPLDIECGLRYLNPERLYPKLRALAYSRRQETDSRRPTRSGRTPRSSQRSSGRSWETG